MDNPWRPANNGTGKRMWFLIRTVETGVPVAERYHYGQDGRLVRYASMAGAQRKADELNATEAGDQR